MEKLQVCLSKLELPLASVNRQFAPVGTTLKECQKVIFQFCIYLIRNNSNMLSGGLLFKKKVINKHRVRALKNSIVSQYYICYMATQRFHTWKISDIILIFRRLSE